MSIYKVPTEFYSFANMLANESEKIIMSHFRKKISIENKSDESPVTIADKNSELKIRELILKHYPDHGIIAEEFENTNNDSEYTWVIDPIDGTRSFISGHKDFGTLIALLKNKKPVLGIINCPAHKERWFASGDETTTMNGNNVKTNQKHLISECYAYSSGLYFDDPNFKKSFNNIINIVQNYRLGGDCYSYGMLASGLIDIVIEDTLKVWDYMALIPVIKNAGGVVTDRLGNEIDIKSDGSIIASCSDKIHTQVLKALNS